MKLNHHWLTADPLALLAAGGRGYCLRGLLRARRECAEDSGRVSGRV
jgi:hypothetical protein